MKKKITISHIQKLKTNGEKIAVVTAYDATMARLVDMAGIDIILVGDSLGMVVQGMENTLGVTLDQMVYHCSMVKRGAQRSFITVDLPFGTFQGSHEKAVESAIRLIKEGGAQSVKIEGMTDRILGIVKDLTSHGIPVMGHVGLIPQSVHAFGGFIMQGREEESSKAILKGALDLEKAGAHAIVLESIPTKLATQITKELTIPTIGIGAGKACDGQVLVVNDLLEMDERFTPKFVKKYVCLSQIIQTALKQYVSEVKQGLFPL
jgi:3-methyl-2-oxobutanoate hydroxymethyltransferase